MQVTVAAGGYLEKLLNQEETSEGVLIRLVAKGEELWMELDKPHRGDEVFKFIGQDVLAVDGRLSKSLDDHTLDVEETDVGPNLVINPRVLLHPLKLH